ncbi:diguanylate cyclase [Actinoplanes sp. NPDC026619]|uniref:GGDEF domain-containing protein n=1 Tax=Actinoplanes sp. NPDC026619 TaxID=3155798 RepID=UPI0033E186CB
MAKLALSALFVTAMIIGAVLTTVAWRRRRESVGFAAIAALCAGAVWWSLCTMVPLYSHDPTVVTVAMSLLYPGVFLVVIGWWAVARSLTNRFWRLDRRTLALLAVEPLLCAAALITNPWHHLFIERLRPTAIDGAFAAEFGPLFWLHTVYSYVVIVYSAVTIFRIYIQQTGRYRGYLAAVLSVLPTSVVNLVGILAGGRLIDLTAIGFALSAPVMYWVARQSTLSLAPVVHREVFQNMDDPVLILDSGQRLVEANPAAGRLLTELGLVESGNDEWVAQLLSRLPEHAIGEYVIRDVRGSGLDFSVQVSPLRDRRGEPSGSILVAHDITVQLRQREQIEAVNEQLRAQLATIEALRATLADQAARDYLTDLHNRRHLMTELDAAMERGDDFAFVLLDIDFFKLINDRHGHNTGDDVLVHVAHRLRGALRPGDLAARYGGEEFALLLHGLTGAEAAAWVDGLRQQVSAEALQVNGHAVPVTFSAGVSTSAGYRCPINLIDDADQALYAAKANGRNRVEQAVVAAAAG